MLGEKSGHLRPRHFRKQKLKSCPLQLKNEKSQHAIFLKQFTARKEKLTVFALTFML